MSLPADLTALLDDLRPAAARAVALERRRRRLRVAGAALGAAAVLAGAAVAAAHFLGKPAPAYVQAQLVPLSQLISEAQTLPGPVPKTARVVAEAPDATLYGIGDANGAYSCAEAVGAARGLLVSASCTTRQRGRATEMVVQQVAAVVDGVVPPAVEYGRAPSGTASLRAMLADGTMETVNPGLDGFWLYEPSDAEQAAARRGPIVVQALAADGSVLRRWSFDPPLPLAVEGTPIARVSGRVEIAGARSVQIEGGYGALLETVKLGPDGSFSWQPPPGTSQGMVTVTALDARGIHLATSHAFDEQAVDWFLAKAKGEPPPATSAPAQPTTVQLQAARKRCVALWNASATPAQKAALARHVRTTAWMDATAVQTSGQWLCILEYTTSLGLAVSGRPLDAGSWSRPQTGPYPMPTGVIVAVDARGRIAVLH